MNLFFHTIIQGAMQKKVEVLTGDEIYIGTMHDCDVYKISSLIFDQFGFVFVESGKENKKDFRKE